MSATQVQPASPFRQPRAVWAVAFATVISFMGIGLVDPILPAIAGDLHATASQVSLLFTSYLLVTAIAMLFVGAISSRIGPKPTMVYGLAIIAVFAALAGVAGSVTGVVGFRAGWGVGNALFIATSLAVIVALSAGRLTGAIVLYETALGIGFAVGPLLGGVLGSISWRGPFFGVAVLMVIALVATVVSVPKLPKPAQTTSISAPLKALRHRGLRVVAITALLYNWGFFTMLGFAPYPMRLTVHGLGAVFFGWGALVALFAVVVAPRLQGRFGTARVLYVNLGALGVLMAVIAAGIRTPWVVIVAVIVSGAFIGVNNTLTTQAVMLVSPVERSVASSAYGFVRFIGGGLAPFVAGRLGDAYGLSVPFYLGAAAFIVAIAVLSTGRRLLDAAEAEQLSGEAVVPRPRLEPVGAAPSAGRRPVIVAVGDRPDADGILAAAARIARSTGSPLEVVRIVETSIVEEFAVDRDDTGGAREKLVRQLDRLAEDDLAVTGVLLHSVGDHAAAGRLLARHAATVHARNVTIGPSPNGIAAQLAEGSLTHSLIAHATCSVVLLRPEDADGLLATTQPTSR